MRIITADCRVGVGPVLLPGAQVGDRVVGYVGQRPGGELHSLPDGAFEPVVSVAGELQQLLDGKETDDSRLIDRRGRWGSWRVVVYLEPAQ